MKISKKINYLILFLIIFSSIFATETYIQVGNGNHISGGLFSLRVEHRRKQYLFYPDEFNMPDGMIINQLKYTMMGFYTHMDPILEENHPYYPVGLNIYMGYTELSSFQRITPPLFLIHNCN